MQLKHRLILLMVFCWLPVTSPQADSSKVALVIGNSYKEGKPLLPNLPHPRNDAEDIAKKLQDLGFDVVPIYEMKKGDIDSTLKLFERKLKPGVLALVFYAGHGWQIKGENYFPSVDADISSEKDVPHQSLSIKQILYVLAKAKTQSNLIFLDACRDNPFSAEAGLARIVAPTGTLIFYATRPGSRASDGAGRNGLYTSKLLEQMDSHQPIEESLKIVAREVKALSGLQEPWSEGSIVGKFCFAGCVEDTPAVPAPAPVPAALDPAAIELSFWDSIKNSTDPADFQAYLSKYSNGQFVALARNRLKQLASVAVVKPEAVTSSSPPINTCSYCPEMVTIPAGSFIMGSSSAEKDNQADEKPTHKVQIRQFLLGKYEVTRQQFSAFVTETGYSAGTSCYTFQKGQWGLEDGFNWQNPGFNQGSSHPAVCVNKDDIDAYIIWLNQKTGKRYRLPTEAEWEYAARGKSDNKTQTARYWGDGETNACTYENVADQTAKAKWNLININTFSCTDGYADSAPVGSFQPNAFGLYDMLGNVYERTCSAYTQDGYKGLEKTCTNDAKSRLVLRGGSWDGFPANVRSADRVWTEPTFRYFTLGFRLAQDN